VSGPSRFRVLVLFRGERVEVEVDEATFGRVVDQVEAAKAAKRLALERGVMEFLLEHPQASANQVERNVTGQREEILRLVKAARAAGMTSDPTATLVGGKRPVSGPGTGPPGGGQ